MDKFVVPTEPMAIVIIVIIIALVVFWNLRKKIFSAIAGKKEVKSKEPEPEQPIQESRESVSESLNEKKNEQQLNQILGTGDNKCICFRNINGVNVADFTTIPKAIGEMYMLDPSCPITGSGFIVKEDGNGVIEDYDPREVQYKVSDSPEMAWFAINWDIVKRVFFVSLSWWKSPRMWFAGIMLAILFISTLVVLGD